MEGEKDKCKITGEKVRGNPGTLVVIRKDRTIESTTLKSWNANFHNIKKVSVVMAGSGGTMGWTLEILEKGRLTLVVLRHYISKTQLWGLER